MLPTHPFLFTHMEIDEILFKTAEETVKKDLTSQFIETARVLYEQDAVDQLSDENLSFFLTSRRGHIGVNKL